MTHEAHQFDPIEDALRAGRLLAPPSAEPSLMDLAAWIEAPDESAERVEAALAADPDLRAAAMAMRLHGVTDASDVDAALQQHIHSLMPAGPHVLARIGGWVTAAAAAVLLAIGGWQLGSGTADTRSFDMDTVAAATFGLQDSSDQYSTLLLFSEGASR